MYPHIQDRTVLYEPPGPVLVPAGLYEAKLVDVRRFNNVFGERVGLVFEIVAGDYAGTALMQAAALTDSPHGKLAALLRGIAGADASPQAASEFIGRRCQIAVRHGMTKTGKPFAGIVQTFP